MQHLEYIERAVDSLLEPVVSGVSRLQPMARLDALSAALTSMCDAWTSNILTKKIRFRCVNPVFFFFIQLCIALKLNC